MCVYPHAYVMKTITMTTKEDEKNGHGNAAANGKCRHL